MHPYSHIYAPMHTQVMLTRASRDSFLSYDEQRRCSSPGVDKPLMQQHTPLEPGNMVRPNGGAEELGMVLTEDSRAGVRHDSTGTTTAGCTKTSPRVLPTRPATPPAQEPRASHAQEHHTPSQLPKVLAVSPPLDRGGASDGQAKVGRIVGVDLALSFNVHNSN